MCWLWRHPPGSHCGWFRGFGRPCPSPSQSCACSHSTCYIINLLFNSHEDAKTWGWRGPKVRSSCPRLRAIVFVPWRYNVVLSWSRRIYAADTDSQLFTVQSLNLATVCLQHHTAALHVSLQPAGAISEQRHVSIPQDLRQIHIFKLATGIHNPVMCSRDDGSPRTPGVW